MKRLSDLVIVVPDSQILEWTAMKKRPFDFLRVKKSFDPISDMRTCAGMGRPREFLRFKYLRWAKVRDNLLGHWVIKLNAYYQSEKERDNGEIAFCLSKTLWQELCPLGAMEVGLSARSWWASTTAGRHTAPSPDGGTPQGREAFFW